MSRLFECVCGDGHLERKRNKSGSAATGQRFWGCTNYPACRYTVKSAERLVQILSGDTPWGWFHGWGDVVRWSEKDDSYISGGRYALVELSDGRMTRVPATDIWFMDND